MQSCVQPVCMSLPAKISQLRTLSLTALPIFGNLKDCCYIALLCFFAKDFKEAEDQQPVPTPLRNKRGLPNLETMDEPSAKKTRDMPDENEKDQKDKGPQTVLDETQDQTLSPAEKQPDQSTAFDGASAKASSAADEVNRKAWKWVDVFFL